MTLQMAVGVNFYNAFNPTQDFLPFTKVTGLYQGHSVRNGVPGGVPQSPKNKKAPNSK
jgi:hypothetical protein